MPYKKINHEVEPWTVGKLRAALADLPDDLPIELDIPEDITQQFSQRYVVTGAGFGKVDWGDGKGMQPDRSHLELTGDFPSGEYEIYEDED